MDAQRFRVLAPRQRVLVAMAVLLDGREASGYLKFDAVSGTALSKAADDLAAQPPELRMPFCGSALRQALRDLDEAGQ